MKRIPILGAALLICVAILLLAPLPITPARVRNSVTIARAPAEVYDYVTTPLNWPRWHPSSLAVSADADHPLLLGQKVGEDFLVAGYRGHVQWTVIRREAPSTWTITGKIDEGGAGQVSYRLTPVAGGTLFEREFDYARPNLLFVMADSFKLRARIEAESAQALSQLKALLEHAPAAPLQSRG